MMTPSMAAYRALDLMQAFLFVQIKGAQGKVSMHAGNWLGTLDAAKQGHATLCEFMSCRSVTRYWIFIKKTCVKL